MALAAQSLEEAIVSAVNQAYAVLGSTMVPKLSGGGTSGVKVTTEVDPGKMDQKFLRALARGFASALISHLKAAGLVLTVVQVGPTGSGTGSGNVV